MKRLFFLLLLSIGIVSCGDSDSKYITAINNNTDFDIIVHFPDESMIVCVAKQETIIEESWSGSVKKFSCMSPYIFKNNVVKIVIDEEGKVLTKDISDDNNWNCYGDKDWSLIMECRKKRICLFFNRTI